MQRISPQLAARINHVGLPAKSCDDVWCLRVCVTSQVWDNLRKILLFNLPVNFAQGTSIFWAYVIGFHVSPLTAIQVSTP
jgi:hypothetical protein